MIKKLIPLSPEEASGTFAALRKDGTGKMRKVIICILVMFSSSVYGQSGWVLNYSEQPSGYFYDIEFINENTGFVCGDGGILKTTNCGLNWFHLDIGQISSLLSLDFINNLTGYACGGGGAIIKTTNGGENWFNQSFDSTSLLLTIEMKNVTTGYITCFNGKVFKTSDSGNSWKIVFSGNVIIWNSFFINANEGYAVITYPYPYNLIRTTNGGITWDYIDVGEWGVIGLTFINELTGYANAENYIYKTTTGGDSWNLVSESYVHARTPIIHLENNTLYTAGYPNIYKSTDEGIHWYPQQLFPANLYSFNSMEFVNDSIGFVVGGSNPKVIFKTIDGGGITNLENLSQTIPASFSLHQNYPNPFNPSTRIKFDIPRGSLVRLKVYDMLGREVAELVNEKLAAGVYEYEWSGVDLPSGVYFYKLEAETFVETRRMVLVK